jgi:hypothetical protein
MPRGVLYRSQGFAAAGSQVNPGCTGRVVPRNRLVTIGWGSPVAGLTGDRAGDHNGHKVLYGGKAAQFWARAIGEDTKNNATKLTITKA